ncbi:MAG: response regulator [Sphingobacteriales bacterium]|nr:MAG: response regulator [Sphingobacteriales bacterium]
MNKNGPVVVIEDDLDDQALLKEVFKELNYTNEIKFFTDGQEALTFLSKEEVHPFLVLSDINLPKHNGFVLRNIVQTSDELSRKSIPYIFFSTAVNESSVIEAYRLSVQGFFLKPQTYAGLRDMIHRIMEYWKQCYSPSSYF